jgi:hypothetical protein
MASDATTASALSFLGGTGGGAASPLPGGASSALDAAGLAFGVPGAGAAAGQALATVSGALKSLGLGGGHGNPDSAFSVGRQKIRQTRLLNAKRYNDADRASELFFSTGRGVEEKKRYKPGAPHSLGNGVFNYSAVSHYGPQKLARLTDAQIIALAPGGKYVPSGGGTAAGTGASGIVGASGVTGVPGLGEFAPADSSVESSAQTAPPASWKSWALVAAAVLLVILLVILFLAR